MTEEISEGMTDEKHDKIFGEVLEIFRSNDVTDREGFNLLVSMAINFLRAGPICIHTGETILEDIKQEYLKIKKQDLEGEKAKNDSK